MCVVRGNIAPCLSIVLLLPLGACQARPPAPSVTILVEGGDVRMANGAAFDDEDRLYVASALGREIIVFDSRAGDVLRRIGTDQGVDGPDDVVVGPDGTIYWTDIFGGEVGRLAPDGTVTKQQVVRGVNPITMSDDGRLFVGLDFLGDALYELDPELVEPPRLIASDFGSINGMDFGPDGLLYGPSRGPGTDSLLPNRLIRIDVDSGEVEVVVDDLGGGAASVRFDSTGQLHALINDQLQRLDLATGEREVFAEFRGANNFAFDSRGRPYVTQYSDGAVIELFDLGMMRVIAGGGLILPGGIAVTDEPVGEVLHVAGWATLRRYGGETGDALGVESMFASTVSAHGDELVLSHNFFGTVETWDLTTRQLASTQGGFATPVNAVGFGDAIVVAELGPEPGTGRVLLVEGDERRPIITADQGIGAPAGLVARDGSLWVSDWDDGALYLVAGGGEPLAEPRLVVSDLDQPEGMAFATDGRLLVAETGAERLTAIDLESGARSVIAEHLGIGAEPAQGMPRTHLFTGVAVGASGAIYVAGDRDNVIYKIELDEN